MFALRGLAVSLSIFALLYAGLSVFVRTTWLRFSVLAAGRFARQQANLLFALRIAPLVIAAVITLVVVVPSFLLLEPRAVNEPLGGASLPLSLCGFALIVAGVWNASTAWGRATRAIARWSSAASAIDAGRTGSSREVPVLRSAVAPPLTVAGVLRPTVWLSLAAEVVLNQSELNAALKHECVHIRHWDNFRKLLLRFAGFPGMAGLENAWSEASEMAADDAAVSSASEALDLASAVIKLSRLTLAEPMVELTTALVQTPAESVNARIARLIAWPERQHTSSISLLPPFALGAAAFIVALAFSYGDLLVGMHAATEWLVR
ncbi:MAG: hypothetical protein WBX38_22075 [Candidatus Sulfotelmatobacter sp.]